MSILSTVKKGYLYMKTSSGYLKLLPRTLANLVSLDNGNSVETEISNIKSAASNLSSTVSGHTTTLNSHGSSISAIKTKTDALKNAANKTVANNLTTTADGYVLDARMGKSLQDSITTQNTTLEKKLATYDATMANISSSDDVVAILNKMQERTEVILYINNSTTYGKQVQNELSLDVAVNNFYGYLFLRWLPDKNTAVFFALNYKTASSYIKTYTKINGENWGKWKKFGQ